MSSDKTPERIWIIGASDGIGQALAKAWSAKGAHVILSARSREPLGTSTCVGAKSSKRCRCCQVSRWYRASANRERESSLSRRTPPR